MLRALQPSRHCWVPLGSSETLLCTHKAPGLLAEDPTTHTPHVDTAEAQSSCKLTCVISRRSCCQMAGNEHVLVNEVPRQPAEERGVGLVSLALRSCISVECCNSGNRCIYLTVRCLLCSSRSPCCSCLPGGAMFTLAQRGE